VIQLGLLPAWTQTPAPPQQPVPATKKIIVQTPFGPKEYEVPVDASGTALPSAPTAAPGLPPATSPVNPAAAQPEPTSAQTVAPPAQAIQDDPIIPISLQFDNAATDIFNVIKIIMEQLRLNYIIDPAVKGTINISTSGDIRRSDLLPILETILKINGATMVRTGNFYQILPAGTAPRQPLPVQERQPTINPDDQMVLQIVRMKYVSATEMATLLGPFTSGDGASIVAHAAGNILLIVERRSNLRKLLEIVDLFDTNVFQDERVRLYPIANNLAREVVNDLTSVFTGYGLSATATAIRFAAIERINSILVIAPNASVFPEVEKWLARLDQTSLKSGIRNHVYRVRNGKAADIQSVLNQLYGGTVQVSSIYNQPSGVPPITQPFPSAAGPTGSAAPSASSTTTTTPSPAAARFTGEVRIIADTINNAIVIQANPQVIQDILATIRELDVLPRQVLIDAQIYEVVLDDSLQFGLSALLQNRGTIGVNPQTTAEFIGVGGPPSLTARTFAFIGRARELSIFLNASENRSRVRNLSAPSVLVSDNTSANIQIGAEIPIPTSSSITPVQSVGTNLFAQTISFRPTGVLLQVRPQINDSGNVSLEISQEVSQATANTTSAVVAPVIGKSSVTSSIVIQDGQTIALGGFIRDSNEMARSRIPLLGRIPIAGALFGNTRRSTGRTELIILITPHVLRTHSETDAATEELKAKLKEVQKLLK